MSEPRRRAVLQGAGALACYALGGSLTASGPSGQRRLDVRDLRRYTSGSAEREDFCWLPPGMWRDRQVFENAVAFAARQNLDVVYSQADVSDASAVDTVLSRMAESAEAGVRPWFATAVPHSVTPRQFVEDPAARERHLAALRSAAERFADVVPDGNLVVWEEAPVAGEWIPGGAWNSEAVAALERYGPELFERQRAAIAEVAPDVAAGLFLHFPYVVETRQPEVFEDLMADLAGRGSLPDFVFTDFYRGWYEKDVGPAPANAAVRSLVTNARRYSRDRPVYFLGQAHTIDPRHTSSTQSMLMDLRAALDAGADGLGWYARTAYKQTRRGFDPFVPNDPEESAVPDGARTNTLTFARDRLLYAYRVTLATRRGFDPADRFDLWLHADSPGFLGHRVSALTLDGPVALGDVAGAHPAVAPVERGSHVSVFHALDATRLVTDGEVRLRIETRDGHDGRLLGATLLPFDPGVAYTEREATRLVEDGDVAPFALGDVERDDALTPDEPLELAVPLDRGGGLGDGAARRSSVPPVADLLAPGTLDHRIALAATEAAVGFDRDDRFDLWVATTGSGDPAALFERFGLDAPPVTSAAGDGAAVFWGVPRDVLGEDATGALADRVLGEFEEATVEAAYAMPYFGSEDLRLPVRVAQLLRESSGEVATYSFAHAER